MLPLLETLRRIMESYRYRSHLVTLPDTRIVLTSVRQHVEALEQYDPAKKQWSAFPHTVIADELGSPCSWMSIQINQTPLLLRIAIPGGRRSQTVFLIIPDASPEAEEQRRTTDAQLLAARQRLRLLEVGTPRRCVRAVLSSTPHAHIYDAYKLASELRHTVKGGQPAAANLLQELLALTKDADVLRRSLESYADILAPVAPNELPAVIQAACSLLTGNMGPMRP